MIPPILVAPALAVLALETATSYALRKTPERVLLSNVNSLTLRKDSKTSHNRVSAIPQLRCVGGTAQGLYDVDVLRCKNAGSSYNKADVEWTCTASLPSEFKLGSTDVICEGFSSSDDPYILKGSCGVEYRLALTELGEIKYGRPGHYSSEKYQPLASRGFVNLLFWVLFIGVVGWMIYAAFIRGNRSPDNNRMGRGWGGGGGGNDDPPPPYNDHPPSKARAYTSNPSARAPSQPQGGWRPGFWTGALGGAAAGYVTGNRGRTQPQQPRSQSFWGDRNEVYDNGEGSSNWARSGWTPPSSSSSPSYGSSRHESSGFGGTSRR